MNSKMRMLNADLPTDVESNYVEVDGGLLVKNVKLLATGTWTDSAVQTPLFYPTHTLEKFATNWEASGYWARHRGGSPRNIVTDRLGEVRNTRYDPLVENGAVMGDVFYDRLTQTSRDGANLALEMAKKGKPMAVSVEWYGEEEYNPTSKRYEASNMTYVGLASVDRGACAVCSLPRANEAQSEMEIINMEAAELTQMLADFKAELLAEVDKKIAALTEQKPEEPAEEPATQEPEMSSVIEEQKKLLAAVEERLKKIEMTPAPKTVVEVKSEMETADVGKLPRIVGGTIYC